MRSQCSNIAQRFSRFSLSFLLAVHIFPIPVHSLHRQQGEQQLPPHCDFYCCCWLVLTDDHQSMIQRQGNMRLNHEVCIALCLSYIVGKDVSPARVIWTSVHYVTTFARCGLLEIVCDSGSEIATANLTGASRPL